MARVDSHHTLHSFTKALAESSQARDGVPAGITERARSITLRNMSHLAGGQLDVAGRRRVRAYFRAVVRRCAARSHVAGAREYRTRVMAASVAADLKASGADPERINREVAAWLAAHEGAA